MLSRRQTLYSLILTCGCVAAYWGIRSVPVEACDLLHYGDFINEEGVIEGCGYEEVGFFNLDDLKFPILAEISPLSEVAAGKETLFKMSLHTSTGKPISYSDIVVSHTERVHAMIVDASLEDYKHIHPQAGAGPGEFIFGFTPEREGTYTVFLDFIPLQTSRRALVKADLQVTGNQMPPLPRSAQLVSEVDGYSFRLVTEAPIKAGLEQNFQLEVKSTDGSPLQFSPVMDSYAHLVAFEPTRKGFAHFHPLNPDIRQQDPSKPDLEFKFLVEEPGYYRVWAQIDLNGVERFIPFDLTVLPG